SARAGVAMAEKEIDRLTITAPFDGVLESDTAEIGSLMQTGSICGTVIQLDPIKVVGFVPETEVNRIQLGARAGARLTTGQEVTGKVVFLSRSADETTRTFRVEIEVANPELTIRDGQTAEVAIGAQGAMAHLLPQSALTLNDDGALGVRVVGAGNITRFMPVDVLRDTIKGVWVSGLPSESDVIVVGQEFVTDGVPINPSYREASK
ncbi:MAG: efflux RND transporter periplasmic adaptor subunit, partial [Pseudomonadota bacterium]|nr:efflux RND transporter periplasmic adaptor subunit [Pseudomonadota bacterium]